jgi:hypothetical protein
MLKGEPCSEAGELWSNVSQDPEASSHAGTGIGVNAMVSLPYEGWEVSERNGDFSGMEIHVAPRDAHRGRWVTRQGKLSWFLLFKKQVAQRVWHLQGAEKGYVCQTLFR